MPTLEVDLLVHPLQGCHFWKWCAQGGGITQGDGWNKEDSGGGDYEKKDFTGLWAGTLGLLAQQAPNQINELRLINWGSDCFVNYIIKLLRKIAYGDFITEHLETLSDASDEDYRLSKSINSFRLNQYLLLK